MTPADSNPPQDGPETRMGEFFHRALELTPEERPAFLEEVRRQHPELVDELKALLQADDPRTQEFLASPLEGSGASLLQPDAIGQYKILRLIGEGGMGRVFLGEQSSPVHRLVAIKLVRFGMDTDEAMTRFDIERRALSLMNHPNIARVFEAGTDTQGTPYFVMEYVQGAPIHHFVAKTKPSLRERVELMIAVCRGTEHAHQKGIIHRDLKPTNILVEVIDGKPVAKIIDFGIAKILDTAEDLQTRAGAFLGTPSYMSPEQVDTRRGPIDTRSDVYALGILLYDVLVGRRPFDDEVTPGSGLMARILEEDPKTLTAFARGREEAASGLSKELDWIALKAISKEPERRYQSASDLAEDLRRYLDHEPLSAGPTGQWYRLRKLVRKNRAAAISAVMVALALVVGLGIALWQYGVAVDRDREARIHLEDYRRMADVQRVRELEDASRNVLWPAWPHRIEAMKRWEEKALEVISRLERHRQTLASLDEAIRSFSARKKAGELVEGEDLDELQWQSATIEELIQGIERIQAPRDEGGHLASIRERIDRAEQLAEDFSLFEDDWQDVFDSMADTEMCPAYRGFRLPGPQMGLVPLGINEETGLWEFWDVTTGEEPDWDPSNGHVAMTEETAVVYVLLPSASARLGAEPWFEGTQWMPYHEKGAGPQERPLHFVDLQPFFLSKFEMTQGQWLRMTGENPSAIRPGDRSRGHVFDLSHPVEQVTWTSADRVARQIGCALPTEAQWEYACRAGTTTGYSSGQEGSSLFDGYANIADEGSKEFYLPTWDYDDFDDGHAVSAPVGSFKPNPFGLYDIHGNVSEWCRDWFGSYDLPVRPGDGLRRVEHGPESTKIFRGGSFNDIATSARSANRSSAPASFRQGTLGLRLMRIVRLDRAP